MENLAEAGEPIGCGEEAMGGCLFALNFTVTGSAVLTEGKRKGRQNLTMLLH
jgi:hypothetical protein